MINHSLEKGSRRTRTPEPGLRLRWERRVLQNGQRNERLREIAIGVEYGSEVWIKGPCARWLQVWRKL